MTNAAISFKNYADLLRTRAQIHPDRIAYRFLNTVGVEESSITYAQLDRQADMVSARLRQRLQIGDRALLLYPQGIDFLVAFMGCLYAGVIAVTVYPPKPNRTLLRLKTIVNDSHSTLALTTSDLFAKLHNSEYCAELGISHWLMTDEADVSGTVMNSVDITENHIALLQYTSGSTSAPKGVIVTHGNLLANQEMIKQAYRHTEKSNYVSWLPLFHDMGLIGNTLQSLYLGSTCVLMAPSTFIHRPVLWLKAISEYRAHTSGGPNFAFDLCNQFITPEDCEELDLSEWKVAFNGAEPVRYEVLEKFNANFSKYGFRRETFCPCYGLAETTLFVSGGISPTAEKELHVEKEALKDGWAVPRHEPGADTRTIVGCGVSWGYQDIQIVDHETLYACPPGKVGEIWIKGPHVAQGYWQKEEATQLTFNVELEGKEGGYLRTGDLGFMKDGQLFVTGRMKDLLIIRGRNYYPQDIEYTAEACHVALRASSNAVFTVEHDGEERVVIVQEVERQYRNKPMDEVILAIRRAVMEHHELEIYALVFINPGSIAKTSSGKIKRQSSKMSFLDRSLALVHEWRADTETAHHAGNDREESGESWLSKQIQQITGVGRADINPDEPIYLYGLDSMKAINLMHRLESHAGIHISMARILEDVTYRQLVEELDRAGKHPAELPLNTSNGNKSADPVVHPLSHGQRSLFFLHKLAPSSTAYQISKALLIKNELDVDKLRNSFAALLDKHTVLRSTYALVDGVPSQKVTDAPIPFDVQDVAHWNDEKLHERLKQDSAEPFDLEKGPIIKLRVYVRENKEPVLLLTVHHIAVDFWSLSLMIEDLGAGYGGTPTQRAGASGNFLRYTEWEAEQLASDRGTQLWDFWSSRLSGELPIVELPSDYKRPVIQTYRGDTHTVKFTDRHVIQAMGQIMKDTGTTPYMYFLTVFNLLINKYTGLTDIPVGSPTSGRSRAAFADMVGYFVNTIVVRSRFNTHDTFREVLKTVRAETLRAFNHQEYPFPLLVQRLQPARDLSRSPLFQVMFVMQESNVLDKQELSALTLDLPGVQVTTGGLELESYPLGQQFAQFDLSVTVTEVNGEFVLSFEYNTDLFQPESVRRMADHYTELFRHVTLVPELPISAISGLTENERHLLTEWNRTDMKEWNGATLSSVTLTDLFQEQVRRTPHEPAIISLEGTSEQMWTYYKLNELSDYLADQLQEMGIRNESTVGLYFSRSAAFVVSVLAVLKAGAVYVPLDPQYPLQRIGNMIRETKLQCIVTTAALSEQLAYFNALPMLRLEEGWEQRIATPKGGRSGQQADSQHAACVIFTSGSSGMPKGSMLTYGGITNLVLSFLDSYKPGVSDRILPLTAVSSASFVGESLPTLCSGGALVLIDEYIALDQEQLLSIIEERRISIISTIPSMIMRLNKKIERYPHLRLVLSGGEQLSPRDFDKMSDVTLVNGYGLTETTVCSTFTVIDRKLADRGLITVGKPIINTQIYLLDENLNQVPVGVSGEIYVSGDGLSRGYLNNPGLTAATYLPNPFEGAGTRMFRTGDSARWMSDGQLEYIARIDRQVKIRGHRVEIGEIERTFTQFEEIQEAVVICKSASTGENRLIGYVMPESGQQSLSKSALMAQLKLKLPGYMVPHSLVVLDQIPRLVNGKPDLQALAAIVIEDKEETNNFAAPKSEMERKLSEIWCDVLERNQVGIYDNFFDIGGHSLLMTQIQVKLKDRLCQEITIVDLFKYPTIHALSEFLTKGQARDSINYDQLQRSADKRKEAQLRRRRTFH
ncbi:non-ribosomal peptide synthetase [Paenibacillus sp. GbtcB18]|uniref:non-ribosomal peptide synthetase n=1 Tax=Paenibacillus sp. GbtcB18 TaxID=2824763 RepID=UPI001C307977|nr:non-ribosomal peptide synthetase [Paenibacillus sp. GbtcB18]